MTLRLRHVLLIGLAATIGVVVGYVLVTGSGPGSDNQRPVSGDATTAASTKAAEGAGAPDGAPTVPDVQGQRLPDAEAQLAAKGYTKLQEVDATPQGRLILEKNNWVVDSQTPGPGGAATFDTIIVLRVKKPTDDTSPGQITKGVVPNVLCSELQAAQDALRASGYFIISSSDATGQRRLPVIDRNWVVIGQSAVAGTSPALTTHITLSVVKHGENTGASGCKS